MLNPLHDYDKNRLEGELSVLLEVQELLINTCVPNFVNEIIKHEIDEVKLCLAEGMDRRLEV